jgi:5-oxoprolinase (ATP-hydrolysing)
MPKTSENLPWEFWVDAGGTFTDCIARRPDTTLVRHKILSSGAVKGSVEIGSNARQVFDKRRQPDPLNFWKGWRIRFLTADGHQHYATTVRQSISGMLEVADPLPSVHIGQPYELSSDDEAPVVAVRYLLGLDPDQPIPPSVMKLGTTKGTNALLTRTGARTAFLTTRGFADILRIGYQNRRHLFELDIRKPQPLHETVVEIDERISAQGEVLKPLRLDTAEASLRTLRDQGIESLAVCLLHAYLFPDHELEIGRLARQIGFHEISLSHQVSPLVKLVSRGDTTLVDAYLNPVLRRYVQDIDSKLTGGTGCRVALMTSSGGLVDGQSFSGKDSILSGPAGGVVGFARAAMACGFSRAIGFDMGGTSTDVSRYDGHFDREFETEKAGVRIVAPMLSIHTVAAGGGSICRFDGVKLTVGPESAGATPGPACYGNGGPLTITDVNLYLGKLRADRFPFQLDMRAVESGLRQVVREINESTKQVPSLIEIADGFTRIANNSMAQAIRSISIGRGYDVRDYVLVAFGGAAGQHACAVARELGMRQILIHPDASLLSALGLGHSDATRHLARGIYGPLSESSLSLAENAFAELESAGIAQIVAEGWQTQNIEVRRTVELRYSGTDSPIEIAYDGADLRQAFEKEHRRLYGYVHSGRQIEWLTARVDVIGKTGRQIRASQAVAARRMDSAEFATMVFDRAEHVAKVFERESLRPGDTIDGPAQIVEKFSTTIVEPGWQAQVYSEGELILRDLGSARGEDVSKDYDPITLEIFNRHFEAIASQMGITLRATATSTNVKERLDFSCAIFTAAGDLVVNAPHIPVHLGAMSETVRAVVANHPDMGIGDVFLTNDPYRGGSHLPDLTAVTPVFDGQSRKLLFFTASRAHHAEIGGMTPGSMPPFSTNLAEEGVLIRNFKIVDAGVPRFDELRNLLAASPYPSRDPATNLSDVSAQIAANQQGVQGLTRLIDRYSWPVVQSYMKHIQDAAARKMRQSLAKLPSGQYRFEDYLDDGARICVCIEINGDHAIIDFAGTERVLASNLNANRAIVTAAVMYVLRCLIGEEVPLNQGVLSAVEVRVPEGMLNPPQQDDVARCAAVAGGNVETSQRVVDVLLGALGLAAASQGTMNNFLFGNDSFGYYETICGGAGATARSDGASAVHTHMTNTRLTDPEVIERRYPVRVEQFSIRRGSGGSGRFCGGDGVVRQITFLEPMVVSLLTQRRTLAPYGLRGGSPGKPGRNVCIRADGRVDVLPGRTQFAVQAGDSLVIETPGGGGYGKPALRTGGRVQ